MANFRTKQAIRVFEKLEVELSASTHHVRGFIIGLDGRRLFPPIYVNKGNKEIPPSVERKLQNVLRLSKEDFGELFRCHMSRREYFNVRRP